MKQKEQLEQLRELHTLYSEALKYTVIGRVAWSEPRMVTRIGGMPKRMQRIGLMDSSDPYIIVHEEDTHEVLVVTPDRAAEWPWPTVEAFPGLDVFLRKNATITKAATTHTPGNSWIRRVQD